MFELIVAVGYPPERINYCPVCGSEKFPHSMRCDGSMSCWDCGLICFIVEHEDSHSGDDEEEPDERYE